MSTFADGHGMEDLAVTFVRSVSLNYLPTVPPI